MISISPLSLASRMAAISTRSRLSDTSVEVLAASYSDLLSVMASMLGVGLINLNSIANFAMKVAVSVPSTNARHSAANVERATLLTQ